MEPYTGPSVPPALRARRFDRPPAASDFSANIEPANVPAVFPGAVKDWKAFSNWNPLHGGLDYLQERVGSASVEAMRSSSAPVFYGDLRGHERVSLSFSTFINCCKFYLQAMDSVNDSLVHEDSVVVPTILEEACSTSLDTPDQYYLAQVPILNTENTEGCPLEVLQEDIQMPMFLARTTLTSVNLWMNRARSRSSAHYDPHHNLLCVVAGCKEECETFDSIEHKEILIGDTKKYGLSLHHLEPLALSTLHKLISMVHNSVQISGQDLAVEPTVQISGQDLAVEPTGTNDLAAERTCTKDVVVDPRNEHKYTALNNSSLLEKDPVASILSSVESPVLQKVLLAMVHNFPRTLEALILHMLSPAAAEVLTRKFDEIDQQTPKEQQNEFYEQFYSIFDDQYAAMEAILNGKESFAFQAFQRVLDQYVGVTIDKPQ